MVLIRYISLITYLLPKRVIIKYLLLVGMPWVPLRPLRHGGQVEELAALAHVAPAPGHLHQGPPRRPHARALRRRTRLQAARQVGGEGAAPLGCKDDLD